ncbi:hypothetical protein PSTT_16906, partial [Puccinia striiformis]
ERRRSHILDTRSGKPQGKVWVPHRISPMPPCQRYVMSCLSFKCSINLILMCSTRSTCSTSFLDLFVAIIFGTSILSPLLSGHKHYLDVPLKPHLTRDFQFLSLPNSCIV